MTINTLQIIDEKIKELQAVGTKQKRTEAENLQSFKNLFVKYDLKTIKTNAETLNIGHISIALLKKILFNKDFYYEYGDEQIIKSGNNYIQLGSSVYGRPSKPCDSKQVKLTKLLYLVYTKTHKGIYMVDFEQAKRMDKRLSVGDIVKIGTPSTLVL